MTRNQIIRYQTESVKRASMPPACRQHAASSKAQPDQNQPATEGSRMNSQQLEYVRQQLIVATADLSGATKGQLVAFAENAQFTATAHNWS